MNNKPVSVHTVRAFASAQFDYELEEWLGKGYSLIGYSVTIGGDDESVFYVATLAKRNSEVEYLPESIVDNKPTMD